MKCPYCSKADSRVIDSRPADNDRKIRRRRECIECGKRFTTYEIVERVPVMVIKKDGVRRIFDPDKLMRGILRACEKRPIPLETIQNMVNEIEEEIRGNYDREVESSKIGELTMEKLKDLDEIAYVRFASVYRRFKDINTFMEEVEKLIKK